MIMQRKYISKQKIHLIEEQGSEFFENRLFNFRGWKEFIKVGEEAGSGPGFSPYPEKVYELRNILKGFKTRKDADATQNAQKIGEETTNDNLKLCVPKVTFYRRARKPSASIRSIDIGRMRITLDHIRSRRDMYLIKINKIGSRTSG